MRLKLNVNQKLRENAFVAHDAAAYIQPHLHSVTIFNL